GFATVASMVVFVDGRPEKARYRTYKVRAPAASGRDPRRNDDFASMYEVLSRRFRRAKQAEGGEDDAAWKLPDLIVVDGGKGQLAMARAAARDAGIDVRPGAGLPIVALAKEREEDETEPAPAAEVAPVEAEPVEAKPVEAKPVEDKKKASAAKKPDRVF